MKLFVFYIGGAMPGAHLELHDMRFAVGETAEACWDDLRVQWWGTPESLHLDAWGALTYADGHNIVVTTDPPQSEVKLWFVHLGGYDPTQFTELHRNLFLVAPDAVQAKKRALAAVSEWASPHKDAVIAVDGAIDLSQLASAGGSHLSLVPTQHEDPFEFEAAYLPIGKMGVR